MIFGTAHMMQRLLALLILWFIVTVCCVLPLGWMIVQVCAHWPIFISQLQFDRFRAALLGRTLLFSISVGLTSLFLGLPAAWALGRGRSWLASAIWLVSPLSLLMPSLVIAYGWKQVLRIATVWLSARFNIDIEFEPAGFWDICRCIWSLATWLWPVPAMVIGLALRRSDPQVQQQAMLDGGLYRVMFNQIFGASLASVCIVSMLAMQEFSVYEPTGISVVATEIRMVFETGAFSSASNPITAPMGSTVATADQANRAAGALAAAFPMVLAVVLLGVVAFFAARRFSGAEHIEPGGWPKVLDAPLTVILLGWLIFLITLGLPLVALAGSLKTSFNILNIWGEFSPQMIGTLLVGGATGVIALLVGLMATTQPNRKLLFVSLLTFLIGGQLLAISLIRLYNRSWPIWVQELVYNQSPIIIMAYIGRFGWIVLGASVMTWTSPWRQLRELAAVDGADSMQTARHVIWPIAWPILGAAALFVLILSLSEVPATVLISPQHPQVIVPMLMTWLHMLRYDAMIEASLLIAGVVIALGSIAIALAWFGLQLRRLLPIFLIFLILAGCRDRTQPEAIWCSTGVGPGQVVYPRGIAYSSRDDSFFIVDREGRVQHLDNQGKCITAWRIPKWDQGKPVGLTVAPNGDLYLPDTHYFRVLIYKPDGTGPIKIWGSKGTGPGQFIYPTDVAFDSAGRIFVSEYGDNDRIQVFDPDGNYLYQFGTFGNQPGQFSRPQSMVIDCDDLYVTDALNHRIQVFKTNGTFVRTMGKMGSNPGEFRFPYGLDIDSNGRLVVCEFGNNRVQLIDKATGKGIASWGNAGREPGELAYPWGVAVDKRGRIVAVDAGNNRLQVFEF